jgi:tRNA pseudouridine55 synthase
MEGDSRLMIHGIINLWKPEGPTSHDMVAKLRKIVGQKRIGHTGTLDPMASGILPLCLGDATRLAEYFSGQTKEYQLTMKFGYTSDTYDRTGSLKPGFEIKMGKEEFLKILNNSVGEMDQIPPMHSAISMNGTRLYELARKGIEIERPSRKIQIYSVEVLNETPDFIEAEVDLILKVGCSKGTYIRSFCNDLGLQVGCGAILTRLERLSNGNFHKETSRTIEEIEIAVQQKTPEKILFPLKPEDLELPILFINANQLEDLIHGRPILLLDKVFNSEVVLCSESNLLAIANSEVTEDGCWIKPKKVFANPLTIDLKNKL